MVRTFLRVERLKRIRIIGFSSFSKKRAYFQVRETKFFFIANNLCLDFINTLLVEKQQIVDRLADFGDLADWLYQIGTISANAKTNLISKWHGTPAGASALKQARQFRSILREMMEGLVAGKPFETGAIEKINRVLHHRNEYSYLDYEEGNVKLKSCYMFDKPVHLLMPIAKSAARLLTQANPSLIKKCENPKCVLFYYDTSKNQRRRWCSMQMCGNRMKAAAHYERKKQQVC